ncbi:MAG: heme biosynthesis HemY N-terminal domain-containing protein [Variibacter sp.]
MFRVIVFFVFVALAALAGAWVAERPGDVAITWLGYHIETSVMVAVAAVAVLLVLLMSLWAALRVIWRTPRAARRAMADRRYRRGRRAVSHGLIAVASGDMRAAHRHAGDAERFARDEPLVLLLQAQAAQLAGDRARAEQAFRAMAERDDTRLLGLRGLYVEAQRRDDMAAARGFAEEAAREAPSLPWAGQAAFDFRCAASDWDGALAVLEANLRGKLIERDTYRRHRAVLLTARATELEHSDPARAKALAFEAAKLAPNLVPAAVLAGRLALEGGERRRAAKVLEAAWRESPHPEIADTYAYLRTGDSVRDRLARVQTLAAQAKGHREAGLAVARAALDAQEFKTARDALNGGLLDPLTQRAAMLMAELEEKENGDIGRAREWMARAMRAARDPAWTADGIVSQRWLPVSPVTGRLDAFAWRPPVSELVHEGAVAESERPAPIALPSRTETESDDLPVMAAPPTPASKAPSTQTIADVATKPAEPAMVEVTSGVSTPAPSAGPETAPPPVAAVPPSRPASAPAARPEPIIPLMHAPDDPGPEPDPRH